MNENNIILPFKNIHSMLLKNTMHLNTELPNIQEIRDHSNYVKAKNDYINVFEDIVNKTKWLDDICIELLAYEYQNISDETGDKIEDTTR